MSCGGSLFPPREGGPEFDRQFKPENNSGCGFSSAPIEGTPRWEWEQKFGKLKTTIAKVRLPIGCLGVTGVVQVVKKVPDKSTISKKKQRVRCCSVRYKVLS